MACRSVNVEGVTAIVCGRFKTQRCACGRKATRLCDFDVGNGKTCDAPICTRCTTPVLLDRDHCPKHAGPEEKMHRQQAPAGTATECRSCKKLVVWTVTEKGKKMPCDVSPSTKGQFYLFRRDGEHGYIEALNEKSKHPSVAKAKARGQEKHESHFATCPDRDQHRKRQPAAGIG